MRKGPDVNDDLHSKDVRQARVITVHSFVGAMAAQGLGFPQLKDPTSVAVSKFTFQTLSSVRHHSNGMLAVTIPTRHLFSLASVVCCVHCPAESESDPFQIQLIAR